ncbi:spore germination protein [Paenibacillus pini]|uniref:Spore germination protein GerKA n=1 Tax=Paenibacillus pini JCM 16418 TaxID=1236976 RepID=W7YSX8_9BACL|nr:spore germination protein [Paenibacillus pini]GAF07741.1 spore germination protein GerKA [Paenibacillus pini JCM 16418]
MNSTNSDSNQQSESHTIWTQQKFKQLFAASADVQMKVYNLDHHSHSSEIMLIYADGLTDTSLIAKIILPELHEMFQKSGFLTMNQGNLYSKLPLVPMVGNVNSQLIEDTIFDGRIIIFFSQTNELYEMSISKMPLRTPDESNTEISIKGPKDGFVEDISTNVALIRKRIRSNSLCFEEQIMGRRTRTKVGLLYFRDIISPKILNEVRNRLSKIDLDGLYTVNQLEELLVDSKYSLFPLIDTTGRPDYVVACLLNGRFVIIVDGNPMVLIGPGSLALLMKSPEDVHFNYIYVSAVRLIRGLSLFLSIVLPAFWVALTAFHQDEIPYRLMATIATARQGLPFSAQMELFLLLLLLEIFREAGVRLPSSIGQTLTVIGGLIIGDASIRAGLVSPSSVVVGAITAVTGATLVNQALSSVVSVLRFALFLISAILGMYGLILGCIVLVIYISRLRTFGISYLSPISPFKAPDFIRSILRLPWTKLKNRPSFLDTIDSDHQGDDKP